MKKFLLICLTALLSTMAWAYDFSAENEDNVTIYYNIVEGGVEVTYETSSTASTASYTGDELTIPSTVMNEGVTYDVIGIGESAFYKPQVKKIIIPGSVKYIGQKAFYANMATNTKLEAIEFEGDGLESIGMQAFYYAPLTSIELPSTVSSMGDQCFRYCQSLVSANIPASLKYVPANTFSYCSVLESISFDGDVEEIYNNAFYQCNALKDVVIPKSVAVIGASAFQSCYALTEITIPEKVDSLGNFAFSDCSALATVTSLNPTPPALGLPEAPSTGDSKAFSGIASDAVLYVLEGCKDAYLAADVWKDFSDIQELVPLEEGSKFQVDAFYYNVVSTADLYVEVTYGNDSYRTATESYTGDMGEIPDTVDYMGYTYHVIGIGEYAFYNCTLTSISLPSSGSVSYIGQQAFYQNKSLVNITMTEGLETLGYRTFYNCTSLESAMLPNSVSSMDENVFYGCTALTKGNIPLSLVELPTSTFSGCSKLETVVIGQENSGEEQAQTKVETIKNNAFYNCTNLANVTIPKTVTDIEYSAFYGCEKALKSIEIPALVNTIGANAFKYCYVLEEVISLNPTPPTCNSTAFDKIYEEAILYVPAGCEEAYKEAEVWKDFYDIQELAPFSCEIDPEDGEIVTELSQITFSNDKGIFQNEYFDSEESPVIVYNSEGEEVSYIDYLDITENADGLEIAQIVILDEPVVEAGDYTVLVAANLFYIVVDGRKTYNNAMTLSYTVEPEDVIQGLPEGYLVDPENESELESLVSFTLSLESGANLTQGSDFSIISVVDHWGQEVTTITLDDESESGKVICTLDEEISTVGRYFINFNKGALYDWSDDGGPSPAFMLTYNVTGAPIEYSFDPEDGAILESLSEFTVGYEDGINDSYSYLGQITVEDEHSEVVAYDVECIENEEPGAGFFDPILSCTIKLNTTITTEGTYTVTIPEGYFTVGEDCLWSDEIVISYTIKTEAGSETGIGGISLDSENVEGIYSIGGQKLNAAQKGVNIVRMNDGNVKKILVK